MEGTVATMPGRDAPPGRPVGARPQWFAAPSLAGFHAATGQPWIEGFQPVLGCIGRSWPPSARPSRTVWKPVPARRQGRTWSGTWQVPCRFATGLGKSRSMPQPDRLECGPCQWIRPAKCNGQGGPRKPYRARCPGHCGAGILPAAKQCGENAAPDWLMESLKYRMCCC